MGFRAWKKYIISTILSNCYRVRAVPKIEGCLGANLCFNSEALYFGVLVKGSKRVPLNGSVRSYKGSLNGGRMVTTEKGSIRVPLKGL